jgi:hypothetical protein
MTTVTLRNKEYELGNFTELQLIPFARFFQRLKGDSLLTEQEKQQLTNILGNSQLKSKTDEIIDALVNNTLTVKDWTEVAETLVDIIIPDIESELVNPNIRRGIFLTPEELLTLYLACLDKLRENGALSDTEIEELERTESLKTVLASELTKEEKIKKLKEELESLEQ